MDSLGPDERADVAALNARARRRARILDLGAIVFLFAVAIALIVAALQGV